MQLIVSYKEKGRLLRRLVNGLLMSGAAIEVKKINYVASYQLDSNKKVTKNEEKMLIISYNEEKRSQLETMLKKGGITEWIDHP